MIRVLVVDDQELVRSGFRIILESEPDLEVVGEAANGIEAVRLSALLEPDVICMDVEMPELSGIEAARQILEAAEDSRPSILILTTFGHESYLFEALAAGVSGFLLKTSRAEQLIDAVRTLAAGKALLGPDVTRAVMQRAAAAPTEPRGGWPGGGDALKSAPGDADHDDGLSAAMERAGLTEREREVLRLLAAGRSNGEIAAELYLGGATVKTHVSNLLQKIGARDRVQLVVWAHTAGQI